jgi:hypothetical protein
MGPPRRQSQGCSVARSGAEEPLLVLLILFGILIVSFGTGETHVTFIDAIFTEILLARCTFNQFVGLDFRPT